MASVTKTITETIREIQKTTSLYFASFEDFIEYECVVKNDGVSSVVRSIEDEPKEEGCWKINPGHQPVGDDVFVEVQWGCGSKFDTGRAESFVWSHKGAFGDITMYRLLEVEEI